MQITAADRTPANRQSRLPFSIKPINANEEIVYDYGKNIERLYQT